jgi:hypothetical protein
MLREAPRLADECLLKGAMGGSNARLETARCCSSASLNRWRKEPASEGGRESSNASRGRDLSLAAPHASFGSILGCGQRVARVCWWRQSRTFAMAAASMETRRAHFRDVFLSYSIDNQTRLFRKWLQGMQTLHCPHAMIAGLLARKLSGHLLLPTHAYTAMRGASLSCAETTWLGLELVLDELDGGSTEEAHKESLLLELASRGRSFIDLDEDEIEPFAAALVEGGAEPSAKRAKLASVPTLYSFVRERVLLINSANGARRGALLRMVASSKYSTEDSTGRRGFTVTKTMLDLCVKHGIALPSVAWAFAVRQAANCKDEEALASLSREFSVQRVAELAARVSAARAIAPDVDLHPPMGSKMSSMLLIDGSSSTAASSAEDEEDPVENLSACVPLLGHALEGTLTPLEDLCAWETTQHPVRQVMSDTLSLPSLVLAERPGTLSFLIRVAAEAASRGNMPGAKHGAIIFDEDMHIVSVGFNHSTDNFLHDRVRAVKALQGRAPSKLEVSIRHATDEQLAAIQFSGRPLDAALSSSTLVSPALLEDRGISPASAVDTDEFSWDQALALIPVISGLPSIGNLSLASLKQCPDLSEVSRRQAVQGGHRHVAHAEVHCLVQLNHLSTAKGMNVSRCCCCCEG